jgi:hypothetical protein
MNREIRPQRSSRLKLQLQVPQSLRIDFTSTRGRQQRNRRQQKGRNVQERGRTQISARDGSRFMVAEALRKNDGPICTFESVKCRRLQGRKNERARP